MADPGFKKANKRQAIHEQLMLGPDTEQLIERIQTYLPLLIGHMVPEVIGDEANEYKEQLKSLSKLLEVIKLECEE